MSKRLRFAQKLAFMCGISTAVISVHAATYAAATNAVGSVSPSANPSTGGGAGSLTPSNLPNAAPANAVNAPVPNQPAVSNTANTPKQANGPRPDWKTEDQYWGNNFSSRPYAHDNTNYTTYRPAFQFGVTSFSQYGGHPFSDINQEQLRTSWQQANPNSTLTWDQAEPAIRDAYDRLYERHDQAASPSINNQ